MFFYSKTEYFHSLDRVMRRMFKANMRLTSYISARYGLNVIKPPKYKPARAIHISPIEKISRHNFSRII